MPGGESSWSRGRSVGGVGRRPVSRGGGGTVVSMWGVWGGSFLWEGGVWCGWWGAGGFLGGVFGVFPRALLRKKTRRQGGTKLPVP